MLNPGSGLHTLCSALAVALVGGATIFATPMQSASSDIMSIVADGKPWKMQSGSQRSGQLTLYPDGTGEIKVSIMRMKTSWVPAENGFCMQTPRAGERCMVLQADQGGFVGLEGNAVVMRLTR